MRGNRRGSARGKKAQPAPTLDTTRQSGSDETPNNDKTSGEEPKSEIITAPRKRVSSRKQLMPAYDPREDTKQMIKKILEKSYKNRELLNEKCVEKCTDKSEPCKTCEKDELLNNIARRLERACYNYVIDYCSETFVEKSWGNQAFVNRYSSIVYKIISNVELSREYCDKNGGDSLGYRIIQGNVDINKVPKMSSYELFPEASQKERDILDFRANQKVEKKFTDSIACPKCGQRKAEPKEVQTSANDEISRFNWLCLVCSHSWFQK